MDLGTRIKTIRLERGLTLPQLSELAGVSIGLLSQLENANDDTANPNLQNLRKIANALKVTIADLLGKAVASTRPIIPERLDPGLTAFLEKARKKGLAINESVLQGCYAMQERDGAPKSADDWANLYNLIKMNFDARRQNGQE